MKKALIAIITAIVVLPPIVSYWSNALDKNKIDVYVCPYYTSTYTTLIEYPTRLSDCKNSTLFKIKAYVEPK